MRADFFGLQSIDWAFEEAYGIMFVQFEASVLLPGKLGQHIAPKHC